MNTSGVISTVAGNGDKGATGDGGPATQATLSGAAAIAVDPFGNLFIADRLSAASTISPATDNNRIRLVNSAGVITTLAGGFPGYNGEGVASTLSAMGGPVALAADGQGNIYVVEASTQRIRKLSTSCGPATLSDGGEAFSSQGGSGSITISTSTNCPWSVGALPPWVSLTSPSSGVGNGTVTFQVSPNNGSGLFGSFEIAGATFSVEQSAANIPGLTSIGSMAQIASAGGWKSTITLINSGTTPAQVRLNFFDNSGGPLLLPLTFPQGTATAGPLLASTLDRSLNPGASLVIETTGLDSQAVKVGWAQLLATGGVGGFATFTVNASHQEAVVPLETRNASTFRLAFDNTGALLTGLAIANLSTQTANVPLIIRDDNGAQLGTPVINLPAHGHTSFMLTENYAVTSGKRGTVEFDTPGGQISVLGLRANAPALTTLPLLANVAPGGGSLAHVASGGGWQSTFTFINVGAASAQVTLSFADDNGAPLLLPLAFPQSGTNTTASTVTKTLEPNASLVIQTQGLSSQPVVTGSAQLTASGNVDGFAIFRDGGTLQEAVVPLEPRTGGKFLLAFDNTNGLATGLAAANVNGQSAVLGVVLRDDSGAVLGTPTLNLAGRGHTSFLLTPVYGVTAGKRGTVEFDAPPGGEICVLGLRATPAGTLTTIPVLVK